MILKENYALEGLNSDNLDLKILKLFAENLGSFCRFPRFLISISSFYSSAKNLKFLVQFCLPKSIAIKKKKNQGQNAVGS